MRLARSIVFRVWIGLNVLLILMYVAGYSAYHGYTWRFWWVELIAVGLPYIALSSVIALAVNVIVRNKVLIVIHTIILLLSVVRFTPHQRLLYNVEPSEDDLTVMSYNVPRWWGFVMGTKMLEMAAFFETIQPDVAALQEASVGFYEESPRVRAAPYVAILFDSLGYRTAEPATIGRGSYTYQPVIGRVDFKDKVQSPLEHPDDYVGGTHVVRTQFEWQGRDVVLYNVHMRTYGRDKPWREEPPEWMSPSFWIRYLHQYRQAYRVRNWEVEQILMKVNREEHPVIIAGDLNSTPHNWVYRRLSEGRQDAFAVGGRGWGMTYHNRLPLFRIDFVLVDPAFEIVDAYVPKAWLSDHRPIVARMRWRDDGSLSDSAP